ncbi:hypothetical protein P22_3844 [Propionispora sp. 2/2-37]|uniref:transposase n=1 Tax=Propionispora sp. 2/2-37 TaxID=1677858 RepID=UPI0006BB6934|nr:transposase [Propionispora sp. 2/2-37]CUH97709.1 hypothetical protein P22_3844 [Propionispora sp. 2/2-37]
MPRQSRKLSESKIYHVMIRGNERKNIFLTEEDKQRFIDTLCEKNKDQTYAIYAYCLMDNHVHLLINEGSDGISQIMKRINISYVYYFNKKYGRMGHLFQDRFKSEPVDTDVYLLSAVRYIHNNPVKAGIVNVAEQYQWSSYRLYVQTRGQSSFVDREFILSLFSNVAEKSIQLFVEYSKMPNDECFIDLPEEEIGKPIQTEGQVKEFVNNYLSCRDTCIKELKHKDNASLLRELISKLKTESNLSVRQIANLLEVNRNIVQRTK